MGCDKKSIFCLGIFLLVLGFVFFSIHFTGNTVEGQSYSEDTSEWSMDGGYFNRSNYFPLEGISSLSYSIKRSYNVGALSSSPAVANGYVYFGTSGGAFYQFNATNISQRINTFSAVGGIYFAPAVSGDYVYFATTSGYFYQLNATNISQQITNYSGVGAAWSGPLISDGYFYGGGGSSLYQLNATNISQLISVSSALGSTSSPIILGDYIYTRSGGAIYQFNKSNVTNYFRSKFISYGNARVVPIASSNGYIYMGSSDDNVYQLNASDVSKVIATFNTGGDVLNTLAISDDYLYVPATQAGYLYQLNATNISQNISRYPVSGISISAPLVTSDYVYVAGDNLYQLNATNISQLISSHSAGLATQSSFAMIEDNLYLNGGDDNIFYHFMEPPSLFSEIISPNSSIYSNSNITFNVSTSYVSSCNYSLDAGSTNITLSPNSSGTGFENWTTLSDSDYVVNFYCYNSTYGKSNFSSTNFSVDAVPEVVALEEVVEEEGAGFSISTKPSDTEVEEKVVEIIEEIEDEETFDIENLILDSSLDGLDFGGGSLFPKSFYRKEVTLNMSDFGSIHFVNNDFENVSYYIFVSEELREFISFNQTRFSLAPGEEINLEFEISPFFSIGRYEGKIYLKYEGEDIARVVPVLIDVKPFWLIVAEMVVEVTFFTLFVFVLFLLYLIIRRYIRIRNEIGGYKSNTAKLEKLQKYSKKAQSKRFLSRIIDKGAIKLAKVIN